MERLTSVLPGRRNLLKWGLASLAAIPAARSLGGDGGSSSLAETSPDLSVFGEREDEPFWKAVRDCFRFDPGVVYLNNGSLGPTPLPVLEDLAAFAREVAGNPSEKMWGPFGYRLEEVRKSLASLVNVSPDDVALTRNTTEGVSSVALGLGLKPGDEVVTTDQEHPGGAGGWQYLETLGIVRKQLALAPSADFPGDLIERMERIISPRTRVLALPHLTYGSGHLLPLAEISALARRRSLLLCVDGAHPPGMMPLDLPSLGCDTYASSSHKWLLAPPGTGTLVVREGARERIAPRVFTGTGFKQKTSRRYDDFGTRNLAEVLAQGSAAEFHARVGPARTWRRIQSLSAHLRKGLAALPRVRILTPLEPSLSGGMTTFTLEGIPQDRAIAQLGRRAHFVVRGVPELNAIRISTGIHNTFAELDLLLDALGEAVGRQGSEKL
jgi:isopenicillin-N epimerase